MGPHDPNQPDLPTGPDALIDAEHWTRLDDYFAERLPLAERVEMDRWAAEHEDRRRLVAQLREVWERAEQAAPPLAPIDIRPILNTLAERRAGLDRAAAEFDQAATDVAERIAHHRRTPASGFAAFTAPSR